MLLALDTATPRVTVALHDGHRVVHRATAEQPMRHGELLAPMVTAALEDAGASRGDLTSVAVGVGPGPYTGLRVGLMSARALGAALGIPVRGVCSLDVLAVGAAAGEPVVATLDARRRELFWGLYDDRSRRVDGPHVGRPDHLPEGVLVVGAGPVLYPDAVGRSAPPTTVDAGVLATAAAEGLVTLVDPEPVYLRRPDAAIPGPPKPVAS